MEFLMDPSIWIGLLTLVVLKVVLGIDHLVFIAILTEPLFPIAGASFWMVVAQITVLDTVFSLGAVITAVGMVDQLGVMMAAVVIAMGAMIIASKPLTRFVNAHPTIVVLCLSVLLMIGVGLVAEGFGFHIPKEGLYAAIGFSIMIETFWSNRWVRFCWSARMMST